MHNQDLYISSNELRELTKSGGSWCQIHQLTSLRIAFSLDAYGTSVVKRADFDDFRKLNPWNFTSGNLLDHRLYGAVHSRACWSLARSFYASSNSCECLTSNATWIARWVLVILWIWHLSSLVSSGGLPHPPFDDLDEFLKLPKARFSVRVLNRSLKIHAIASAPNPKGRSDQTEKALSTWLSPLQSYFGQWTDSAKRSSRNAHRVTLTGAVVSSRSHQLREAYLNENRQAL